MEIWKSANDINVPERSGRKNDCRYNVKTTMQAVSNVSELVLCSAQIQYSRYGWFCCCCFFLQTEFTYFYHETEFTDLKPIISFFNKFYSKHISVSIIVSKNCKHFLFDFVKVCLHAIFSLQTGNLQSFYNR